MPNVTVSTDIDSFLKTSSKSSAAQSIKATPLDSINRIPAQYINGSTYTPIMFQPGFTTLDTTYAFTTPSQGDHFITYDISTLAIHVGSQSTSINIDTSDPANVFISPGDTIPFIQNLYVGCSTNLYLMSSLQTTLPNLTVLNLTFSNLFVLDKLPKSLNYITLYCVSTSFPSSGLNSFYNTLCASVTATNGYCNTSNCLNKPTSASQSARASLTARGWSIAL
jgi:hypothetical protein